MTLDELKAEAKRQGYALIKKPDPAKLMPCKCGKKPEHWYVAGGEVYMCQNCGIRAESGRNRRRAIIAWNKLMEES